MPEPEKERTDQERMSEPARERTNPEKCLNQEKGEKNVYSKTGRKND